MDLKIEKKNEVYLTFNCEESQQRELYSYFRRRVPKYIFHPLYRKGLWDGYMSFYDIKNNVLPIGLTGKLQEFCKRYDHTPIISDHVKDTWRKDATDEEVIDFVDKLLPEGNKFRLIGNEKYKHQLEIIKECLIKRRGVVEAATGGGKSAIIHAVIRWMLQFDFKILLVVPNISLTDQMYSDFESYGFSDIDTYASVLYYDSGKYDENKPILISTWQSIYKKDADFFKKFDGVLIDETHIVTTDTKSVLEILKKCTNAQYRFGFTGTLPAHEVDQMNLFAYIGPQLYSIKSAELIDRGVLSNLVIAGIQLKYPPEIIERCKNVQWTTEMALQCTYKNRNKVIAWILNNINKDDNVLILCNLIKHTKSLKEYIDKLDLGYNVEVIRGEVSPEERERIRKITNEKGKQIIVATYQTMSIGVNINRLQHVVFASSSKSPIRVLQSIGRGLRLHLEKNKLIVWDLIDDLCFRNPNDSVHRNFLWKHWITRKNIYRKENFKVVEHKFNLG